MKHWPYQRQRFRSFHKFHVVYTKDGAVHKCSIPPILQIQAQVTLYNATSMVNCPRSAAVVGSQLQATAGCTWTPAELINSYLLLLTDASVARRSMIRPVSHVSSLSPCQRCLLRTTVRSSTICASCVLCREKLNLERSQTLPLSTVLPLYSTPTFQGG